MTVSIPKLTVSIPKLTVSIPGIGPCNFGIGPCNFGIGPCLFGIGLCLFFFGMCCARVFQNGISVSGHISMNKMIHNKIYAAIDRGAAPRSKTVEFLLWIILVIEIWPLKV